MYEHAFGFLLTFEFTLPSFSFDLIDLDLFNLNLYYNLWDIVHNWRFAMPADLL